VKYSQLCSRNFCSRN